MTSRCGGSGGGASFGAAGRFLTERRHSNAAVRYPAKTCETNSRTPNFMLCRSVCPTVRITNDGPEQTQAGSSASASCAESWPVRTACAAAWAAGANPPKKPIISTRAAQRLRTPMSRAKGRNGRASTSLALHWISSDDTTRNGNSDSSSGPPQSASPSASAFAQVCGAANGSTPTSTANRNTPI